MKEIKKIWTGDTYFYAPLYRPGDTQLPSQLGRFYWSAMGWTVYIRGVDAGVMAYRWASLQRFARV